MKAFDGNSVGLFVVGSVRRLRYRIGNAKPQGWPSVIAKSAATSHQSPHASLFHLRVPRLLSLVSQLLHV
jgi:hypothetical protein